MEWKGAAPSAPFVLQPCVLGVRMVAFVCFFCGWDNVAAPVTFCGWLFGWLDTGISMTGCCPATAAALHDVCTQASSDLLWQHSGGSHRQGFWLVQCPCPTERWGRRGHLSGGWCDRRSVAVCSMCQQCTRRRIAAWLLHVFCSCLLLSTLDTECPMLVFCTAACAVRGCIWMQPDIHVVLEGARQEQQLQC
ncbi:hypothetical protein COO60DRAFT_1114112 [Scenedesmus sp. NREL 46B-D3]|nr:hypothetical protein COO60DRAFT_1114112 [Scenedesmus sp. NREL 46B-D3]